MAQFGLSTYIRPNEASPVLYTQDTLDTLVVRICSPPCFPHSVLLNLLSTIFLISLFGGLSLQSDARQGKFPGVRIRILHRESQ